MKIVSSEHKTFLKELFARFQSDKVPQVGAQLAYYLLMSVFPLIIFVLSLMSFTSLGQSDSLGRLLSALPRETADLLQPILMDLVSNRSGSVLGLSLFLALWSGSNGISNLIAAMDAAYDIENARKKLLRRIIAVGYTILLAVVIVIALGIQVFGDQWINTLVEAVPSLAFLQSIWIIVQYVLPLIIIILILALLYKFGPGFPQNKFITFGEALIGASIAGVLWSIASMGFSIYVNQFGNYANTYGSLGGVIVLMIWLYLTSVIIMLGAEITATYISRFKGGLERQVVQTILENPQDAVEAGTMLKPDEGVDVMVRPIEVGLIAPKEKKPLYKRAAFYAGSAVGGVLGWGASKLIKRREEKRDLP